MSAPIFISFASRDRSIADTVCAALESRGFPCWISSRDIDPGENFQTAIVQAIRSARVMVLVFSANSNNSDEIKKELALASQSHLVVIPVRIEDVTPDAAFAYEFAIRQWIDAFDDWEQSISRLADQVSRAASLEPDAAVTARAIHPSPPGSAEDTTPRPGSARPARRTPVAQAGSSDATLLKDAAAPSGRSKEHPQGAAGPYYSAAILATIAGGVAIAIAAAAVIFLGVFKAAAPPGVPTIASVSAIQARPDQTIEIFGRGFGALAPYVGNSDFVRVSINDAWNAGSNRDPGGDLVTLSVASWTDSKIVIDRFSGQYGQRGWTLKPGDRIEFQIWNPQTKAGPARFTVTAAGIDAVPAPATDESALELGVNRPGSDIRSFNLPSADPGACREACARDDRCHAFTYVKPGFQAPSAKCWLKSSVPEARSNPCCISGVK